jgi:hypothetical protein
MPEVLSDRATSLSVFKCIQAKSKFFTIPSIIKLEIKFAANIVLKNQNYILKSYMEIMQYYVFDKIKLGIINTF